MKKGISFFDEAENSVGNLCTRLADDARLVADCTGDIMVAQLQALFTLVIGLAISLTAAWQVGLVVVATLPLTILANKLRVLAARGQL